MATPDQQPSVAFTTRKLIDAYGDGGFRFGGLRVEGSVLLLTSGFYPWPVSSMADMGEVALAPIWAELENIDLLLLGCGETIQPVPAALGRRLQAASVGLEQMDTGSACRLYNQLLAEDRRLAAALIAVS